MKGMMRSVLPQHGDPAPPPERPSRPSSIPLNGRQSRPSSALPLTNLDARRVEAHGSALLAQQARAAGDDDLDAKVVRCGRRGEVMTLVLEPAGGGADRERMRGGGGECGLVPHPKHTSRISTFPSLPSCSPLPPSSSPPSLLLPPVAVSPLPLCLPAPLPLTCRATP